MQAKALPIELGLFGPRAIFEHIGLAVSSIAKLEERVLATTDPIQRVKAAFVNIHGVEVELIEPAGDHSPVTDALSKGHNLLDLCHRVPDFLS